MVAVLFSDGDHVPLTKLVELVGNADNVPPEQIAETWVNVGVIGLVTVIIAVFEQPRLFL